MSALVSIIIPVYNVEQYVRECLDSIINQTYKELEIIIINNGSTDFSGAICEEYVNKDNRICYILQENSGVSVARNTGLDNAKGKYVCFCDSDDTYELDYVETMIQTMRDKQADFVICGFNQIVAGEKRKCSNIENSQFINQEVLIENIFLKNNIGGFVWNKLFKKELLDGVCFDENYQICEDTDFVLQYVNNCTRIYVMKQALYNYRDRQGSAVNSIDNLYDKDFRLKYAVVYKTLLKLDTLSEVSKEYIRSGIYMLSVSCLCDYKIKDGTNEEIIKQLKNDIRKYQTVFFKCSKVGVQKKIVVVLNRYFNIRRLKRMLERL